MIVAKVKTRGSSIEDVIDNLGELASSRFIRDFPVATYERTLLNYIKEFWPKGSRADKWQNRHEHSVKGWFTESVKKQSGLSVKLKHKWKDDPYYFRLIQIIEKGHKAYSFIVKKRLVFLGTQGRSSTTGRFLSRRFVIVRRPYVMNRPARAGRNILAQTEQMVQRTLVPKIERGFRERAKKVMRRKKGVR